MNLRKRLAKAPQVLSVGLLLSCTGIAGIIMPLHSHAQSSAATTSQKVPLKKLLDSLSGKSPVRFAYDRELIEKYSLRVPAGFKLEVNELLGLIRSQTDLGVEQKHNTIVLFSKGNDDRSGQAEDPGTSTAGDQQHKVTGTVRAGNDPLEGVSVSVQGQPGGVLTNASGVFTIAVPNNSAVLLFSIVGYQSRQLVVGNDLQLEVQLEKASTYLDQVVVVGYGTQKRTHLTGAVSQVPLDKAESRSFNNPAEMLQGKVPGVVVQNEGGDPTVAPRINIRGLGGINGESVLWVVDGVITPGGPPNPADVESMTVLKDASAAIYGARASGGVILVTTRKGRANRSQVNVDVKYGIQSPWKKLQPLNASDYADISNLAADNAGQPRKDVFDATKNPDGRITRTNWMDEVFRTGYIQDYNVSVSGGSDKSVHYMSFGYRHNDAILLNTQTDRFNFRLNSSFTVNKWLKIGENLSYQYTKGNGANTNSAYEGAIISAIFYPPNVTPYKADGSFNGLPEAWAGSYGDVINPVAYLQRIDIHNPTHVFVINPYLEIGILRGLNFRSNLGITKRFSTWKEFRPKVLEPGKRNLSNELFQSGGPGSTILAEQTLNYNTSIAGEHNITAVAGYTYQKDVDESYSINVKNFDDEREELRYFQNAVDYFKPGSGKSESALISYLARITYDYQDKYLLTAIVRRDGTSKLGADNRWEVYPSVSAGWRISQEKFMSNIKWLSDLKLRGSYGVLGNLGSLDNVAINVPLSTVSAYLGQNPVQVFGLAQNGLSNPNLRWAKSKQTNIGIDMAALNNRITFSADYFIKRTQDMLLKPAPTVTLGVSDGAWKNAGEAEDKGIELNLGYNSAPGKAFQYSVNVSATRISNKLLSLSNDLPVITGYSNVRATLDPVRSAPGEALYSYYVVRTNGLFKSQEEVNAYKNKDGNLIQPNAKPGDLRFIDKDGDGTIDNDDKEYIGNAYPDFSYGISFNASYKNFDLNLFAQGVQGNKLFNGLKFTGLNAAIQGYNMLDDIKGAWTPQNPNADIPRVSYSDANGNFGTTSDWYIEKGSYLRIKNITLGYTLPARLSEKMQVRSVRLYVTGNNVLTITKYTGFDPEVGMDEFGIDKGRYPQARAVFFGLNVNF
ncbi:TonB-dependent receptor [Paraflavitalea sp. CAU 1676]|uniref:SusC/RagA family TonB-linked outer membrane protein n=1 Tax=Paraflavitalea sp. CAU 1676 TaxID=3032598 RepID=UPI0023DAB575|nr:TonB-dependent receptor [Paraflavitalea sp. CAU 1676]MDF2192426.1 TonB-dependent receptor [Paraflavitalea sp. CAU 1676]